MQRKPAEVLLLTGYLGSGKTTLLKFILLHQTYYKVAVVQNEFSDEMGIEAPLMKGSDGKPFDKFYELPNGCICCTAKTELVKAIEYLIELDQFQLDYILVETNGLADPSKSIESLWIDEELDSSINLRSIFCIVSASNLALFESKNDIFQRQIIYADLIILNKIDLLKSQSQKQYLLESLRKLNQTALIQDFFLIFYLSRTQFCQISDLELIFKSKRFDSVPNLDQFQLFKCETVNCTSQQEGISKRQSNSDLTQSNTVQYNDDNSGVGSSQQEGISKRQSNSDLTQSNTVQYNDDNSGVGSEIFQKQKIVSKNMESTEKANVGEHFFQNEIQLNDNPIIENIEFQEKIKGVNEISVKVERNKITQQECDLVHIHANEDIGKYSVFSYFYIIKEEFEANELEKNVGTLVWDSDDGEILRIKGLIQVKGSENYYSLQGVGDVFELRDSGIKWEKNVARESRILVICRKKSRAQIGTILRFSECID